MAINKLKSHKSPGIDEISEELFEAGGGTICLAIHKLITSIWKKEKLPEEWKESIIVPIHKKLKLRGLSPQANYTDRAAAAGRRS